MENYTLKKLVLDFVEKVKPAIRTKPYDFVPVKNLLLKEGEEGNNEEKCFSLLSLYKDELAGEVDDLNTPYAQSSLANAVDESIRKYPRSKNTALKIYLEFADFFNSKYNTELEIKLPNYIPETPFERQIEIVKLLQHSECSSIELAQKLYISQQSVLKYLKEMESDEIYKGLIVDQKKVKIHYSRSSQKYSIKQTIHPLVLTLNLRQVITLLEGLCIREHSEDRQYAYPVAQNVWNQLTDYAKNQIKSNTYPLHLKEQWYSRLDGDTEGIPYIAENQVFNERLDEQNFDWVYLMKSRNKVQIILLNEDGSESTYEDCRISRYNENKTGVYTEDGRLLMLACVKNIVIKLH